MVYIYGWHSLDFGMLSRGLDCLVQGQALVF